MTVIRLEVYKANGTKEVYKNISLEEGKRIVKTAANFEKLCSFEGIHTKRFKGFVG